MGIPRPTQAVTDKALRLIADSHVRVFEVQTELPARTRLMSVAARVTGDTGVYYVRYYPTIDPNAAWVCSCPATVICAHITAVALVTGVGATTKGN